MKRFREGEDGTQITLLLECPDDYLAEDNPIRAVEVFIDEGTWARWDCRGRSGGHRPPVLSSCGTARAPSVGLINRIQSSWRLEREAQRSVEVMWLTGRLFPDFKTITDFRRSNGPAIRNTCCEFILLCRD